MTKNKREDILSRAETLVMGSGVTLSLGDGRWRDTEYLFVRRGGEIDGERFFRDLSREYEHRQELDNPDHYDRGQMDRDFSEVPSVNSPPPPLA